MRRRKEKAAAEPPVIKLTDAEQVALEALAVVVTASTESAQADLAIEAAKKPTAEMRDLQRVASDALADAERVLNNATAQVDAERHDLAAANQHELDLAKQAVADAAQALESAQEAVRRAAAVQVAADARQADADHINSESNSVRVRGLTTAVHADLGGVGKNKITTVTAATAAKLVANNLVEYVDEPE